MTTWQGNSPSLSGKPSRPPKPSYVKPFPRLTHPICRSYHFRLAFKTEDAL